MAEFKVGDRVFLKGHRGKLGTVIPSLQDYARDFRVWWDGNSENSYHGHYRADSLKLAETEGERLERALTEAKAALEAYTESIRVPSVEEKIKALNNGAVFSWGSIPLRYVKLSDVEIRRIGAYQSNESLIPISNFHDRLPFVVLFEGFRSGF